jgi:hypothetical protein
MLLFGSPNWLIGIVGWAALAAWMLWGRWPRAVVPYLPLWLVGMPQERPRRQIEMPSAAVLAMLGAGLLAIVAASEPELLGRAGTGRSVTVIVDRGLTMSGLPEGGDRRFVDATAAANQAIDDVAPGAKIILKIVPPLVGGSGDGEGESLDSAEPTDMMDADALTLAARRAIANTPGLVLLVSNQIVPVEDPRFVQVTPDQAINGVGIDSLEVVGPPHPQAMVRITNQSVGIQGTLTIHSDDQTVQVPIALPDRGEAKNYFVDLPNAGKVIEADLTADGDTMLDQKAWSVQRLVWPKVQAETGVLPELLKMIDVYGQLRPAGADSPLVTVSTSAQTLSRDANIAVWATPQPDDVPVSASQGLQVATGPLSTDGVDWNTILSNATAAQSGPEGDWEPIVTVGRSTVVAVRERPTRQVWVGFGSDGFADRADFVVFWSEVFNWLGNAGPVYGAKTTNSPAGDWKPVLYKAPDGTLTAYNAPPLPEKLQDHLEWRQNLAQTPQPLRMGERPIGGVLVLGALLLVCIAAATWRVDSGRDSKISESRYMGRRS